LDESAQGVAAIVVSLLSLGVAAFALGWNVYRDVVMKARLRVHVAVSTVMYGPEKRLHLEISGTNHGPGELTIEMITGREGSRLARLIGKGQEYVVIRDNQNPLSTKLPKRILVGERVTLLFPYAADCFLGQSTTRLGLQDSFGRVHWAPSSKLRAVKARLEKDFGGVRKAG